MYGLNFMLLDFYLILLLTICKKLTKRRTSIVWKYFDPVNVEGDDMLQEKCKACDIIYKALREYETENITQHIKACERKDTPDVRQMLLSGSQKGMSIIFSKFYLKRFIKLVVVSIIKHDLPF